MKNSELILKEIEINRELIRKLGLKIERLLSVKRKPTKIKIPTKPKPKLTKKLNLKTPFELTKELNLKEKKEFTIEEMIENLGNYKKEFIPKPKI